MRILIQEVSKASVTIDNKIYSSIRYGYLLFVGFTDGDNQEIVDKMVDKLLGLRIFPDSNGQTNLSLADVNGEILSISQFTLYADASHGRRPSFINALSPHLAEPLYDYFNKQLELKYRPINTGVFGADMDVYSLNEGPFTLVM
mgnify:CR=1 FL=1